MPRATTQTAATNRWIRENAEWLRPEHQPLVQQLKMLARSCDVEMRTRGRVVPATASAYRQTFTALMDYRPEWLGLPAPAPAPAAEPEEADDLLGPAAPTEVGA